MNTFLSSAMPYHAHIITLATALTSFAVLSSCGVKQAPTPWLPGVESRFDIEKRPVTGKSTKQNDSSHAEIIPTPTPSSGQL